MNQKGHLTNTEACLNQKEVLSPKEKEGKTPAKGKKRKKGESVEDEDEEDFIIENEESEIPESPRQKDEEDFIIDDDEENEESENPAVKKGKTSKIVLSKPPKKKAKQTSNIVKTCYYCKVVVSSIDIKAKNVLVRCSGQKTH